MLNGIIAQVVKLTPSAAARSVLPQWSPALRWSAIGLGTTAWTSAALFGMYTLAFYFGAIPYGRMDQWNIFVPGLYDKGNLAALLGIGAHFAMGAIILLLGPVQLIGGLRARWPRDPSLARANLRGHSSSGRTGRIGLHPQQRHNRRRAHEHRFRFVWSPRRSRRDQDLLECSQQAVGAASSLGHSPLRARDRIVALPPGLWILAIRSPRPLRSVTW